jgi:hypothetical protein
VGSWFLGNVLSHLLAGEPRPPREVNFPKPVLWKAQAFSKHASFKVTSLKSAKTDVHSFLRASPQKEESPRIPRNPLRICCTLHTESAFRRFVKQLFSKVHHALDDKSLWPSPEKSNTNSLSFHNLRVHLRKDFFKTKNTHPIAVHQGFPTTRQIIRSKTSNLLPSERIFLPSATGPLMEVKREEFATSRRVCSIRWGASLNHQGKPV